ncbi:MAG: cbb3-type cytochrome c oxidase subunit 3 [Nitrospirae bacterium]|nr:cbb3-type cytochrome c oxidase subunit 3 [Nitrospirota bacterium]
MSVSAWVFLGFTALLFLTFVGLILYYYAPKRKSRVERPKYTVLDDDEPKNEEVSDAGKRRHSGRSS